MRVISGKYRGKKIFAPLNDKVRPTTDRIKETLFNILASKGYGEGVTVLDLFGGTGALGIEALSRGAEKAIFIDNDPESVRLIRQNLLNVKAPSESYEVYNVDFAFALKKLKNRGFDIIFADPPYAGGLENEILNKIDGFGVLAKDGILMIEHSRSVEFSTGKFIEDRRVCGNTVISFLSYPKEVEHNE